MDESGELAWKKTLGMFFGGIVGNASAEFSKAEKEIEKALTVDPAFLERRILSRFGIAYANNEGLSFKELERGLRTTSSRLTRNLASLCKRGIVVRRVIKRFPRNTDYRLSGEGPAKKALTYWVEDQNNSLSLRMAINLRESLNGHLSGLKNPVIVDLIKKNREEVIEFLKGDPTTFASILLGAEAYFTERLKEGMTPDEFYTEQAFRIASFYLNPDMINPFFEANLRRIITRVLFLLAGDLKESSDLIFLNTIKGVEELSLRARHETPMMLYGFYTLEVCNSIMVMLGKTEEDRMRTYRECIYSVFKFESPLKALLEKSAKGGEPNGDPVLFS